MKIIYWDCESYNCDGSCGVGYELAIKLDEVIEAIKKRDAYGEGLPSFGCLQLREGERLKIMREDKNRKER